jgi:hypothetical protein
MRLTPDNIRIALVEAYGTWWQDALSPDQDVESFTTQLQMIDAVRCPRCDEWWEDGDLVTTDAHADAWCGPCWEAEAQEADLHSAYYDHCWEGADDADRIQSKQRHDRKEAAR